MNSPRLSALWTAAALAGVCLTLAFAIDGESLFTDEGYTAWLVAHPSLSAMWRSLYDGDSSELQMIAYNVYLWLWTRLFGHSEYAMRLANLPFIALFVASIAAVSRIVLHRRWAWMAVALSPFAAVFVNQCRAYTALVACAAASTGALLAYIASERFRRAGPWLCLGFLLAGTSFHIMTLTLAPALAVIVIVEARSDWRRWLADWRRPLLVLVPFYTVAGVYIAWTFAHASRYKYDAPHPLEPLYTLYKFLGFWSLGPSNSSVAGAAEWAPAIRYALPVAAGGLLLAAALAHRLSRRALLWLSAFGVAFAIFVAFSFISGSGLSARHCSALLPLLLFILLDQTRARWRTALLASVWIVSFARLATLEEYRKDDYRGAVESAISLARSQGGGIIWAADPLTAGYYGLRLANPQRLVAYGIDYEQAIARVPWPVKAHGLLGIGAAPPEARILLDQARAAHGSAILGIPTRLPFVGLSAFWRRLPSTGDQPTWTRLIDGAPPAASFQLLGVYVLK